MRSAKQWKYCHITLEKKKRRRVLRLGFRRSKLKEWKNKYYADKHVVKREDGEVRAGKGEVTVRKHVDDNNKLSLKPFSKKKVFSNLQRFINWAMLLLTQQKKKPSLRIESFTVWGFFEGLVPSTFYHFIPMQLLPFSKTKRKQIFSRLTGLVNKNITNVTTLSRHIYYSLQTVILNHSLLTGNKYLTNRFPFCRASVQ